MKQIDISADLAKLLDDHFSGLHSGGVLADLSQRRELQVYLGDPTEFSKEHALAVTYAPVPSFAKYSDLAEIHPYPWLRQPHAKSVRSFSAWRGK
jgi:deoxyribodipyrimidine photo-lyase